MLAVFTTSEIACWPSFFAPLHVVGGYYFLNSALPSRDIIPSSQ